MQDKTRNPLLLVSWLYTHNPFYLISTLFVLYAIKLGFRPESGDYVNPWGLMAALSGFTLLTAFTGWVVVRCGKVWEDGRTILLVLVLMFLAMSVSFDEILNLLLEDAIGLLAFGFLFSVSVSEGVLRGLNIKLPAVYRLPMYLMFGLFFAYPLFVSHEMTGLSLLETRWRIALFPLIAGLLSLTLLPAIRRGSQATENNGTPWKWPLFPWTVFGFLAFAVIGRSYSLSISFDDASGPVSAMQSIFGFYQLVPFLLVGAFLLLEISFVEKLPKLQNGLMWFVGLLPILAFSWRRGDMTHYFFLREFVATLGSPVLIALGAVTLFYLIAWNRGVRSAEVGVMTMLFVGAFVNPRTIDVRTLSESPHWLALSLLAALLIVLAVWRHNSAYALAAACLLLLLTGNHWPGEWRRFQPIGMFHLLIVSTVGIGLCFRTELAEKLLRFSAIVWPVLTISTSLRLERLDLSLGIVAGYLAAMIVSAGLLWYLFANRWFLAACLVNIAATAVGGTWFGLQAIRRGAGGEFIEPLLYGCLFFVLAVLISAHKAGFFERFKRPVSTEGVPPQP